MTNTDDSWLMIVGVCVSFVIAAMLNVYPLSAGIAMLRPMILMMVLLFWLTFKPKLVGLHIAFLVGLVADLLFDTRLGQQAFCAVLMAFFVRFSSLYMRRINATQAWLLGCVCLLIFQLMLWFLQFVIQDVFIPQYFGSLLMSMVCYPLVLWLLGKFLYKPAV